MTKCDKIIKLSLGSAFLLLLVMGYACRNSNGRSQSQQISAKNTIQTPINWIGSWQFRESKKQLVNSAVREYEFQHQNINVNIKYQEEFCGGCKDARVIIQDTIVNIIRSGKYHWDIIPLTQKYYSEIAKILGDPEWGKKYLVDFGQFDWFHESHIEQIFEVSQYKDDFGGIYAGPLIEGRNNALWYNTETAKRLGIQVKNTGMTYNDFKFYCQKVYEYNQSATKDDRITFFTSLKVNDQVTDIFNSLVLSELGPLHGQLPDKQEAKAAIKNSLEALEELAKLNAIDTTVNAKKDYISNLEGKVLFTIQVSSWYNQCETEDKEKALNLVPAELPVYEKSGEFTKGSYQSVWAVFKNAPHRDEAIDLLKYISSNDIAERWLSSTYNPTGLKVKLNASDFGQNDIEKYNNYIEKKFGKNMRNFDLGTLLFGRKMVIDPTKVFNGSMTAQEFYSKNISQL